MKQNGYTTAELLELDPEFHKAYEEDYELTLEAWDRR